MWELLSGASPKEYTVTVADQSQFGLEAMKRMNTCRVAVVLAVVAAARAAIGQTLAPAQEDKPVLSMTISLKQKTVTPRAKVIVSIDVVNISDQTQMVRLSTHPSPYTNRHIPSGLSTAQARNLG
jgi:hypothetical protein